MALARAPRAACHHRERAAWSDDPAGRCKECVMVARIDDRWAAPRPARILGVTQHASATPPPACPKCGAWWETADTPRYLSCHMCGRDWHAVGSTANLVTVVRTHARPHLQIERAP